MCCIICAGFLFGCTFALIIALVLIIRARHIFDKQGRGIYMETMFPLYSLFGFVVLHMMMYAANIYLWRRYRVNYSFIFGFKEGTELGYREVLLLAFSLSVLALASILANLDMEMDPVTEDYKPITELLPLGLVVVIISLIILFFCLIKMQFFKIRFLCFFIFAACDCDHAVPFQHLVPFESFLPPRLPLPLPLSSPL